MEETKQLNINFIKDKKEEIKKGKIEIITRLKYRLNCRGFGVTAYARAYKGDVSILTKILKGELDGSKGHRGGSTRKIMEQLKEDKVWIGRLPWEVK